MSFISFQAVKVTFRSFFFAKSVTTSSKLISHKMSAFMLIRARWDNRSLHIDVQSLFFISFNFENERSTLQLLTISNKYMQSAIWKWSLNLFFKNQLIHEIISRDTFILFILECVNEFSKLHKLISETCIKVVIIDPNEIWCCQHLLWWKHVSLSRKPNCDEISWYTPSRCSKGLINWSITGRKFSIQNFSDLLCIDSICVWCGWSSG